MRSAVTATRRKHEETVTINKDVTYGVFARNSSFCIAAMKKSGGMLELDKLVAPVNGC